MAVSIARGNLKAFAPYAILAIVTACGGGGAPFTVFAPESHRAQPQTGDLLYVAHAQEDHRRSRGVLSVLAFPQGKPVATIGTDGFPLAACSDASGDVWAVVEKDHGRHWSAYEFARGGTQPIAKIHIPNPRIAQGCAVDPTTGNLAIASGAAQASGRGPFVDLWAGAREGAPQRYPLWFTPYECAYDDRGNLFVNGSIGSTIFFELAELPAGGAQFIKIALGSRINSYPGGIAWDGKYLALVNPAGRGPAIYRVEISSYTGTIVDVVHFKDLYGASPLVIADGTVVAATDGESSNVALRPYPGSRLRSKTLARFQYTVEGLAVSNRPVR